MREKKKINTQDWVRCPEAEKIIEDLVGQYHAHLKDHDIACFLKPGATKGATMKSAALSKKASPELRAALKPHGDNIDYLVLLPADLWPAMPWKTKEAMLDHQLAFFAGRNEVGKLEMHEPDIVEFVAVIQRHGAWTFAVENFLRASKQLDLPVGAANS